ncbi:MAG: hypothetical protein ACK5MV_12735 [Aminipila sp.]
MITKGIVLFARPYTFTDKDSGKSQSGISLSYIDTSVLAPYVDEEGGFYGYQPLRDNINYSLLESIKEVPAIYDMEVKIKAGSDGKPVMKVVGLKFVSSLK